MRLLTSFALLLSSTVAPAQRSDGDWSKSLPAGTVVSVYNIDGNITVLPGSGNRVEVSSPKGRDGRRAGDRYVVVQEFPHEVVVCVLVRDTDESCDEDGAHMHPRRSRWSQDDNQMDVTVRVPSSMTARAHAVSGDISITGAHGDVYGHSVSGDVRMDELYATSIRAES